MLFLKIAIKTDIAPTITKIRGICMVWKSTNEIPINATEMKEKIIASNNGRFKEDQTHGIGHIISNIKLLLLIL